MKAGYVSVLAAACLAMAAAYGQVGHPAKGSWLGYWGPDQKTQRRLVLNLDWRDQAVVGEINPGPNAAKITHSDLDYTTWSMTLEAQLPNASGALEKWVAVGKIENLGSWTNRRYSGTYTQGAEHGTFQVTLH
jgi:hypothetical protein